MAGTMFFSVLVVTGALLNAASKVYIPQGTAGITLRRRSDGEYEPVPELLRPGVHRRNPIRHRRVFTYGTTSCDILVNVKTEFHGGLKFNIGMLVQVHAPESLAEAIQNFTARWRIYVTENKDHVTALKECIEKYAKAKIESIGLDLVRDPSGTTGGAARLLAELNADQAFVADLDAIDGRLTKLSFELKDDVAAAVYGKEPFISASERPLLTVVRDAQALATDTRDALTEMEARIQACDAVVGASSIAIDEHQRLNSSFRQLIDDGVLVHRAGVRAVASVRRLVQELRTALEAVQAATGAVAGVNPAGLTQAGLDQLNANIGELSKCFEKVQQGVTCLPAKLDALDEIGGKVIAANELVTDAHAVVSNAANDVAAQLKQLREVSRRVAEGQQALNVTEGRYASALAQVYELHKPRDTGAQGRKKK